MRTERLLLSLLTLGVAAWLLWSLLAEEGAAPQASLPTTPSNTLSAADAGTIAGDDKTATRSEVAPPAAVDAWLDHAFVMELRVRIVDRAGLPIAGHRVRLAPFGSALNRAEQPTGPDGSVLLTFRARTPTMQIELADPRDQLRRVMLTHGQRGELTLLGAADDGPRLELAFTAATESGGNAPGAVVRGQAIRMVLGGGAGDLEMRPGLHPFVVFQDRLGAVDATPTADTAGPNLTYTLGGGNGTIQLSGALFEYMVADKPAADATAAPSPLGAIAGVVYGEDGKPVPKVLVALLGTSPQPLQRAQTDDHGSYHFDNLQPGDYTVRAGGDRDGLATAPATVTTGTTPTDVQLRRDACVRGRAVDSHDQPFANATVQWDALDGSWSDATTTGDDGTFVLANLPGGPGRLLLFPPQQTKMPIAVAAAVLPDTGKTVLRAPTGSSLQLTTVKPSELAAVPYNQLTIRVWQTATDLGLRLQRPGKGDLWQLDHLPAGDYEVELRFPGGGRRDLGRHWLDGEHAQDLGRVELPRGGHLQVALTTDQLPTADNERAIEIASLRRDADVRLTPAPDPGQELWLPAGDYAFAYRATDGSIRRERFRITLGERTVVPAPK